MLEAITDRPALTDKLDFLRLLLENGSYCFLMKLLKGFVKYLISCFRVDPTLNDPDDDCNTSAFECEVLNKSTEALVIMQEFVEIPDKLKLLQLTMLMHN